MNGNMLCIKDIQVNPENIGNSSDILGYVNGIKGRNLTISQLKELLEQPINSLNQLGLYDNVTLKVALFNLKNNDLNTDKPVPVVLTIYANKLPKISAQINTDISTDKSISAGSSIVFRNLFDKGEKINLSYEKSVGGMGEANISVEKFSGWKAFPLMKMGLFHSLSDMSQFSNIKTISNGLKISSSNIAQTRTLAYALEKRTNLPIKAETADLSPGVVKSTILPSLMSSISYSSVLYNTTDSSSFPTSGSFLKATSAFSGLGGDVKHIKLTAKHGIYKKLLDSLNLSVGFTSHAGLLHSFESFKKPFKRSESLVNERFFLGGVNSFPGFTLNSIGQRSNQDCLGGDYFLSNKLNLSFSLPWKILREQNIRASVFGAAGWVSAFERESEADSRGSLSESLSTFIRGQKVCVGVALDWPLEALKGSVRLCASKPLRHARGDSLSSIQLGVAFEL